MVRPTLPGEVVGQHLAALPLGQLLQGGFIVPSGGGFLLLLVQHQGVDQLPGLANASVQIDGSQQRLHRIGLDGGGGPPPWSSPLPRRR